MAQAARSTPRRTRSMKVPRRLSQPPAPQLENVFTWAPEGRTKFVELVALQSLLSKAPVDPVQKGGGLLNVKGGNVPGDEWRILPAKVEQEVADHFAFLAAVESGSEFVSATCIEERSGGGIVFRLAMTEPPPRKILEVLRGICDVLQLVASRDLTEHAARNEVWERVLEVEEKKIVKDLKQKFKRSSWPLPELFREALGRHSGDMASYSSSLAGISGESLPSAVTSVASSVHVKDGGATLETIYMQCQDVVKGDLSGSKVKDEVRKLLDTCYRARRSKSFKNYMASIRARKQLVQMVEKLGRYKAACHSLISMSKRYPQVFSAVEVQTVDHPLRGPLPPPQNTDVGLAKLASDLTGTSTEDANQKLTEFTGLSKEQLLTKYEDIYMDRPHVHAEIQLVKFYEEHPSTNPPKFIGSSKRSCFLCALFLRIHGNFEVSKTYPAVYTRWTVPSITCKSAGAVRSYTQIMDEMSRILEINCRNALSQAPSEARRRRKPSHASADHSETSGMENSPIIMSHPFANISTTNISLSVPVTGNGKSSRSTTPRQIGSPRAVASRASTKKVEDWPSRAPSPKEVPLPPSVLSSRSATPKSGPIFPGFRRWPTATSVLDEAGGGVTLEGIPGLGLATTPNEPPSGLAVKLENAKTPVPEFVSTQSTMSHSAVSSIHSPIPQMAVAEVQTTPVQALLKPADNVSRSSTPMSFISTNSRVRTLDASAASTFPAHPSPLLPIDPTIANLRGKGKDGALLSPLLPPQHRPKPSNQGSLNLTIERNAKGMTQSPEFQYTIYLAGDYAEGLAVGDEVFSGTVTTAKEKERMIQCKGFRLKSSLRERERKSGEGEGPLKVHQVVKTSEKMVLDIAFSDAIVRMEVFWDS